nr:MAG TPA: hypothetical protein [Caudoviricetes sp.]
MITSKCDSTVIPMVVEGKPIEVGSSSKMYPHIEELTPVRVGPVATPFMLHTTTSDEGTPCVQIKVDRVVECPNGCDMSEFKYPFPLGCGASHLLPAGVYDITVCKQEAASLEIGDVIDLTLMVEPVTDSFASIYLSKV